MTKKRKGIGGHQSAKSTTDTWLTPPHIIKACGDFDLDPACPVDMPWKTAKVHYTPVEDGLAQDWFGRVWLNSPYGNAVKTWIAKIAEHGNGIALTFARTETVFFQQYIFQRATSILYIAGRLTFLDITGTPAPHNGGAPSVLVAYGKNNAEALDNCGIEGHHQRLRQPPIVIVGASPSWKAVVSIALRRCGYAADVQAVYVMVERIAPDKVHRNKNYKAKVRQKLQTHFLKVKRGVYGINS